MQYISCNLPVTLWVFDVVACEEREDEAVFPDVDIMVLPVVNGGAVPKCLDVQGSAIKIRQFWFVLLLQPF